MDEEKKKRRKGTGISRREFLKGMGTGAVTSAALSSGVLGQGIAEAHSQPEIFSQDAVRSVIKLKVNGVPYKLTVEHRQTLAEVLRDELGLTGTKIGCNMGECGACTVLMNGKSVYSCSQLAVWADGKEIITIEGLAQGDKLNPIQQAFIDYDGMQCGFCTSGQIISAKALLDKNPKPTEDEIKRGLSGNLCRCGNYNRIVDSVMAASKKL